ncbi:MAG TPA: error-prone DNA polymerase [Dehalococcoidia bacterium]|nr:error-prone DNA polymerase [Dehalococcoidia bacterium]
MTYAELHLHTSHSLLDGASLPEEMVARAAELGYSALAITDHDGLYGVMPFYNEARDAGIKPIVGVELTVREQGTGNREQEGDSRTANAPAVPHAAAGTAGEHNGSAPPTPVTCHLSPVTCSLSSTHVTLLARDQTGYSNLCRLITTAHMRQTENNKGDPAIDFATLAAHHAGLICLSGCRNGEISQHLLAGRRQDALAAAQRYASAFGPDSFYVELQHNLCREDDALIRAQVELAGHLGLGYVATGNAHYHLPERHKLQDVLVSIRHRATLDDSHHLRRPNADFYLKSPAEMAARFAAYPLAVANSLRIADACNARLDFSAYRFPDYEAPNGLSTDEFLEQLCREGAQRKYGHCSGEVEEKLRYELNLIRKHGLAGYFLIVWDLIDFARKNRIPAQGRGSAANSIIAFVLDLTRVDPIRHRLFVGRFLNEELQTVPDIDIDFSREHREQVIQYLYEKYGRDHAALVCTVVTFQARNAVREVGKALGLPPDDLDRVARHLHHQSAKGLEAEIARIPGMEAKAHAPIWRELAELCEAVADFPRHLSQHVGGMVISSCPLAELVPLEKARMPGRGVTQWDKDGVGDAGLIKIDLLSLGMLALIDEAVELVDEARGLCVDLEHVPLDNADVYDTLSSADTLGIFQVESRAQMQSLPRSQPRNFLDIVAQVAIIRPGPLQGNMVHPYLRRRRGQEEVSYAHPKLEPVLEETLGVILYQEQCIRVAIEVAGFSAGEADQLRRAMSRKRSAEAMAKLQARFFAGCGANGVGAATAAEIWQMLQGFAQFGFCKSHAAAFAWITYQSAWLRLYYREEFYAALLNNQPMGFYSPEVVLNDAKRHGVEVLPVDVNASRDRCTIERGGLRLGFRYVEGLGETQRERLDAARLAGEYRSLGDFCRRTGLAREAVENLIAIGAFDAFGLERRELLWQLGLIYRPEVHHAATRRRRPTAAEAVARRLLTPSQRRPKAPPPLRPLQEALPLPIEQDMAPLRPMTPREQAEADYAISGLSARWHWLEFFRPYLTDDVVSSLQLERLPDGTKLRLAGLVVCRQKPGTAKGFMFVTLEDEWGLSNVIVKPAVYERYRTLWRLEPLIVVAGELQRRDGTINVMAHTIAPLPVGEEPEAPTVPESHDFS